MSLNHPSLTDDNDNLTSVGFDYLKHRLGPCVDGLLIPLGPGELEQCFVPWCAAGALPDDAPRFRDRLDTR